MIAYAPQADAKTAKPHDCGCGCGGQCGCEARCCDLECLVRPKFFCGQLLTDSDLGAMVDWARNRFALTRYRDGWGVVCGLDVTCGSPRSGQDCCPDPHSGPTVYVNPGYAIDCCGNDLVVCDPIPVDLGQVCQPLEDPCDELPKGKKDTRTVTPQIAERQPYAKCWEMLSDEMVAVDVWLRYHEDLAQGQRAMLRSSCSDTGACEYTRVRERPCVHVELGASDNGCDDDDDWQVWQKRFDDRRERFLKEMADVLRKSLEDVVRYLRRHPPYRFCFIEDFVCCLLGEGDDTKYKRDSTWRNRVGFWLYYDWLLHELECACGSCRPDRGVPLARVLLRRFGDEGAKRCRVMLIDTAVPHRRPLRKDPCRPIPRGAIDLAPYLWQPKQAAIDRLSLLGIRVSHASLDDTDPIGSVLKASLWLRDAERGVHALLVKDPFECERVAGFEAEYKG